MTGVRAPGAVLDVELSKGRGGKRRGKPYKPSYLEPTGNVKAVEVTKPAMSPAAAVKGPAMMWRHKGKFAAGTGAAALGAATYLHYRKPKEPEVAKYDEPKGKHRLRAAGNVAGGAAIGTLAGAGAAIPAARLLGPRLARRATKVGVKQTLKSAERHAYGLAALPVAGAAAGAAAGSRKNEHLSIGAKSYFGKRETTMTTLLNPFDGQVYEVSKAARAVGRNLKGAARSAKEHVSSHKFGYGAGAAIGGAAAIDTRNNIKTYKEAKEGKTVGAMRRTYYPLAYNLGDKKRQEALAKGMPLVGNSGPIKNLRQVKTPKGLTGAAPGFDDLHVRGKGTSPRRTASQHFTGTSGSRRTVSLKV